MNGSQGTLLLILAAGFIQAWLRDGKPSVRASAATLAAMGAVGSPWLRPCLALWIGLRLSQPGRERAGWKGWGDLVLGLGLISAWSWPLQGTLIVAGALLSSWNAGPWDRWRAFQDLLIPWILVATFFSPSPALGAALMTLSLVCALGWGGISFLSASSLAAAASSSPEVLALVLVSGWVLSPRRESIALSGALMGAALCAGVGLNSHGVFWMLGALGWGIAAARAQAFAGSYVGWRILPGLVAAGWALYAQGGPILEGIWSWPLPAFLALALLGPLTSKLCAGRDLSWRPKLPRSLTLRAAKFPGSLVLPKIRLPRDLYGLAPSFQPLIAGLLVTALFLAAACL